MARKHAFLISLAVAAALVAGVLAALRTTELGAAAATTGGMSDAQISARDRELDRIAKRLRSHARKRPPKLPALRTHGGASSPVVSTAGSASSAPVPAQVPSADSSAAPAPSPGNHFDDDDDHAFDHDDDAEDRAEDLADDLEDAREDAADEAEDRADDRADEREDARDDD